jgi:hypothetical protein
MIGQRVAGSILCRVSFGGMSVVTVEVGQSFDSQTEAGFVRLPGVASIS